MSVNGIKRLEKSGSGFGGMRCWWFCRLSANRFKTNGLGFPCLSRQCLSNIRLHLQIKLSDSRAMASPAFWKSLSKISKRFTSLDWLYCIPCTALYENLLYGIPWKDKYLTPCLARGPEGSGWLPRESASLLRMLHWKWSLRGHVCPGIVMVMIDCNKSIPGAVSRMRSVCVGLQPFTVKCTVHMSGGNLSSAFCWMKNTGYFYPTSTLAYLLLVLWQWINNNLSCRNNVDAWLHSLCSFGPIWLPCAHKLLFATGVSYWKGWRNGRVIFGIPGFFNLNHPHHLNTIVVRFTRTTFLSKIISLLFVAFQFLIFY